MDTDIIETDGRNKRDIPGLGKGGGQGSCGHGSGGRGEQAIIMYKSMGGISDNSALIFSYCHTFNTWGFAWNDYDIKLPNKTAVAATRRVTSCAQLVRNELSMFITPSDFMKLPADCYVTDIGLEVIPISTEASFQTGSTLAGSATLKHSDFALYNSGCNLQVSLEEISVEFGSDMKLKAIKDTEPMAEIMWGKSDGTGFGSCTHLPRNFKNYVSFIVPKGSYESTGNIFSKGVDFGQLNTSKIYSKYNLNEQIAKGGMHRWHYAPRIGVIKQTSKADGVMQEDDQFLIGSQHQPMGVYNVVDQSNVKKTDYTYGPITLTNNQNYLTSVVKHGFWSGQMNRNNTTPSVCSFSEFRFMSNTNQCSK